MKNVIANDKVIPCAKAVKGADFLWLYDEIGTLIASFNGVSDFSGYSIEGDWDAPVPTVQERIDALEVATLELITRSWLADGMV